MTREYQNKIARKREFALTPKNSAALEPGRHLIINPNKEPLFYGTAGDEDKLYVPLAGGHHIDRKFTEDMQVITYDKDAKLLVYTEVPVDDPVPFERP